MITIDLPVDPRTEPAQITQRIAAAIAQSGLRITLQGTLAAYPGCLHWHLKQGKEPGTLELTWWPAQRRLWFKVASGRRGAWIEVAVAQFRGQLELPTKTF